MANLFENAFLNKSNEGRKQTYNINDASVLKRIMAGLVDFILTFILAFGIYVVARRVSSYQTYQEKLTTKYIEHGMYVVDETNYDIEIDGIKYRTLDETNDAEAYKIANEALNNDEEALNVYHIVITTLMANLSISCLIAILLLDFVVPLIFKNGRTIGGFFLHIGLISTNNTKIKNVQLFARAVVGRFAIETMFPIIGFFIFGLLPAILIFGFEFILFVFNKHHQLIRNVIANVITVDHNTQYYASNTQELEKLINESKNNEEGI